MLHYTFGDSDRNGAIDLFFVQYMESMGSAKKTFFLTFLSVDRRRRRVKRADLEGSTVLLGSSPTGL